jgi:hypothetical protein
MLHILLIIVVMVVLSIILSNIKDVAIFCVLLLVAWYIVDHTYFFHWLNHKVH